MAELTTLAKVKTWLGITDNSQDDLLTSMKDTIEEAVRDYCETNFEPTVVSGEILDGRHTDIIVPERFPIISVQALVLGVNADGSGGYPLDVTKDIDVRSHEVVLRYGFTPKGRGWIKLAYTHGYASVPKRVEMAVWIGVEFFYRRLKNKRVGITSRAKEGESESYGNVANGGVDSFTGLPPEALALLGEYRVIEFPTQPMAARNH